MGAYYVRTVSALSSNSGQTPFKGSSKEESEITKKAKEEVKKVKEERKSRKKIKQGRKE